jgi:hypothetical protein
VLLEFLRVVALRKQNTIMSVSSRRNEWVRGQSDRPPQKRRMIT